MTRDEFAKRLPKLPQGYYWKLARGSLLHYRLSLMKRGLFVDKEIDFSASDEIEEVLQRASRLVYSVHTEKEQRENQSLYGVYQNDEDITCHGGCATGSCCTKSGTSETVDDALV